MSNEKAYSLLRKGSLSQIPHSSLSHFSWQRSVDSRSVLSTAGLSLQFGRPAPWVATSWCRNGDQHGTARTYWYVCRDEYWLWRVCRWHRVQRSDIHLHERERPLQASISCMSGWWLHRLILTVSLSFGTPSHIVLYCIVLHVLSYTRYR